MKSLLADPPKWEIYFGAFGESSDGVDTRLSALPATALRGDVLPERVLVDGLLILRDGEPGEPEVTLSKQLDPAQDEERAQDSVRGLIAGHWVQGRV